MGQEHRSIPEILGNGGVCADARRGDRCEIESCLLLKELESRVELAVEEAKLGLITFRVDFHFGLECRET